MSGSNVGNIRVLEYYGTSEDEPIMGPINGLIRGESVTHAAAELEFSKSSITQAQQERLTKLHNEGKLYLREYTAPNGTPMMKMHVSFWPKEDGVAISQSSKMHTPFEDNITSREFSPFNYDPRFIDYLQPASKEFSSTIPLLKHFIPSHTEHLPPAIIMNLTGFKAAYPEAKYPGFELAAIDFGQKFTAWANASIDKKNPDLAKEAELALQRSQESLFGIMFPGQKMDQEKLMQAMDKFVTLGNPPTDSASLPLTNNPNSKSGLVIGPMVDFILDLVENPGKHPYNLALNNCANIILEILQKGIPERASDNFKMALGMVPILNLEFSPPITLPGRVSRMADNAAEILDDEAAKILQESQGLPSRHHVTGNGMKHHHAHHLQHQKPQPGMGGAKVHAADKENDPNAGGQTHASKTKAHDQHRPIPPFVDTGRA